MCTQVCVRRIDANHAHQSIMFDISLVFLLRLILGKSIEIEVDFVCKLLRVACIACLSYLARLDGTAPYFVTCLIPRNSVALLPSSTSWLGRLVKVPHLASFVQPHCPFLEFSGPYVTVTQVQKIRMPTSWDVRGVTITSSVTRGSLHS